MMNTVILIFFFWGVCAANATAQSYTKKVVFFTDKGSTPYSLTSPSAYLSNRALERRSRYKIPIDSTDIPVLQRYIDSVAASGSISILGKSKWLNAVLIQTTDSVTVAKINSLSFVKKINNAALRKQYSKTATKFLIESIDSIPTSTSLRTTQTLADTFNYGFSANQILIHNGQFLHNVGARGQGMAMAFLDAGFKGYATNRFFDSARARNQFLGTWDFVSGNSYVNEDHPHGLHCLSIVAAYIPGTFVGSCPEANYYLFRTENDTTEQVIEEYNWCIGAEYADSVGVDVISSSVGYNTFDDPIFNHTYADMNGNTTIVSRMADLAAKKGMLVVNSAGNSGADSWKFITAPADGDSVLSVGAVNKSGVIANFSSFGPTSNGQIKPDLVSVGLATVLSNTSGNVSTGNGTSFSCPNMAGLVTCLWQLFPEYHNWKIITALRQSADRFTTPHEQYGYGIPNMKKAFGILVSDFSTLTASLNNFTTTLNWSSKDHATMRYQIERKLPNEIVYTIIETIQPAVNLLAVRTYQYNDVISNSSAGTVSYRIRQIIDTTTTGFDSYLIDSATVILSTALANNNSKMIQFYPNPVQSNLTIKFKDQPAADYVIQIFNQQGQLVNGQVYKKPTGSIHKQLEVSFLSNGNYILTLKKDEKIVASHEFMKQ